VKVRLDLPQHQEAGVKKLAIAAVLALVLIAAGCGGGGGGKSLSKEEYSSQLNTICTELNDKNKAIGDPQSIDEVVTKGPQLQDAFQSAIDEVENLNPPDELKDAHERFVSLGKQIHSKIDDLIAAAKKKDLAKAQQIGATIDPLNTESTEIARTKLGAPACDQG
jgi:hypothetical protein